MNRYLCVGAGFSGAVIARELAERGNAVVVIDERPHLAGNCHTERDVDTGIQVHRYGPHIFHTDDKEIWDYLNRFGRILPYTSRVKTTHRGTVFSFPINLHTINQFFGTCMNPGQARQFISTLAFPSITESVTLEEYALSTIGRDLYEGFVKGYTIKQWGLEPSELPASILKRLPLRFNYDDNYFDHRFQGMPEHGYTDIVARILHHPNILIALNTAFESVDPGEYLHVFYTGPIDRYYRWHFGRLRYRTLHFREIRTKGDFQGTAVMNYADREVPYTRITEHKHFYPWEPHEQATVCFEEYSSFAGAEDIPFYPIRLVNERALFARYKALAERESKTTFVGRLGTYRYLDMDSTVREALDLVRAHFRER